MSSSVVTFDEALAAIKTDDIATLKQYIRQCLATARELATAGEETDVMSYRIQNMLSQRDNSAKQSTLLHWAAYLGNEDAVKLLAHYGADINAFESDGKTALHWAAYEGHFTIVEYLLFDCSAKPDTLDLMGNTPCHLALRKQYLDVARLLPNFNDLVLRDAQSASQSRSGSLQAIAKGIPQAEVTTEHLQACGVVLSSSPVDSTSLSGAIRMKSIGVGTTPATNPPSSAASSTSCSLPGETLQGDGLRSIAKVMSWAPIQHERYSVNDTEPIVDEDDCPQPAPILSVRPTPATSHSPLKGTLHFATMKLDESDEKSREIKSQRREAKRQQLLTDLFSRYVMQAPTPQKPIRWLPSSSSQRESQSIASYLDPCNEDENYGPSSQRHHSRGMSQVDITLASLAYPQTSMPDVSLYRPPRESTSCRGTSRSTTPRGSHKAWRPPSRVVVHSAPQPVPDPPHPAMVPKSTEHKYRPRNQTASDASAPRASLSRMEVRSY